MRFRRGLLNSSIVLSSIFGMSGFAYSEMPSQDVIDDANIIFNWAEKNHFDLFGTKESIFPDNRQTITNENGWVYRYYPNLNNYIGIRENNVYVAGSAFEAGPENPLYIKPVNDAMVLATTIPLYIDQVVSGVVLPYSVLRNDLATTAPLEIRNGGFGSSATAHPTHPNQFYALTDRGPNATYTGANGKGKIFPVPDYTPRIGLFELSPTGQVNLIKQILLKDISANPITGLPNSSALGGTGETPYDADGNTILDDQGNIKLDDFGLDGEGLVALNDGSFWVSDEYGPHIVHFDSEGKEIGRINPFANDSRNIATLPAEYANRRANRGMEGLAITPDQKTLVGIMQSTMYNPDSSVKALDITRIVSINLETKEISQYLYRQDKAQNSNSEIVALTDNEFLIIERDGSFLKGGAKKADANAQKLIYKIDTSQASNLESIVSSGSLNQDDSLGLTIDGLSLEQYVLENGWEGLVKKGIKPVQKTKIADMVELFDYPHDKMEGLWCIDSKTIGVLNDDDFSTWSSNGILEQKYINEAKTDIDSNRLYIINDLNLTGELTRIATYNSNIFDESAAEIVSYDSLTQQFFVTNSSTNSIDVLTLTGTNLTKVSTIKLAAYGGGVNSVSAHNGLIAVAMQAKNKQANGTIEFFSANGVHLKSFTAGALPDMVTFSKDGTIVMAANEGEPSDDYSNDPRGSVTIINIFSSIFSATATTIDFSGVPLPQTGMKFHSSDKLADLEPEYIAINDNATKAYVTLQENNGMAIINLTTKTVEKIVAFGFKDFSRAGNEIDANKDGNIELVNINAFGLYQPDSIAVYTQNGQDFIVTANEGDDREYAAYEEETKLSKLTLDPELDTSGLSDSLRVTPELGDIDGDGDYDQLYMMGARSFSIWNSEGSLIYDSGSELARNVINAVGPYNLNTRVDDTDDAEDIAELESKGIPYAMIADRAYYFEGKDARSEKKGIEPEALAIGTINNTTYAFIGLEKQGGIMMYDISNPEKPKFIKYVNTIDYTASPDKAGDLGPEGMTFIAAAKSPNGKNLLVVANEVSGSTTIYEVKQ